MKLSGIVALAVVLLMPAVLVAAHSDYGCDSCHTPHHGEILSGVPLWNGSATESVFTPYSSDTLDAAPGQPDGSSKLCLSCHDGANPSYGWMTDANLGVDLTDDHPISFVYTDASSVDAAIKSPSASSGLGGTIAEDLLDPDGKMQCHSCHDVHTSGVGDYLLRGLDYFHGPGGGEFCRMCHIK